jgi:hypothetical protein
MSVTQHPSDCTCFTAMLYLIPAHTNTKQIVKHRNQLAFDYSLVQNTITWSASNIKLPLINNCLTGKKKQNNYNLTQQCSLEYT